jgi:hypothetical protein
LFDAFFAAFDPPCNNIFPIHNMLVLIKLTGYCILQTLLIKEIKFTILANLILLSILMILLTFFTHNYIEYLMLWTILSAALRLIGHIFEPLPPFLIDNSGQFSPVNITTLKKLGLFKTIALFPIGFLAEFLSGQPQRSV